MRKLALLACVLLAACGGDDDGGGGQPAPNGGPPGGGGPAPAPAAPAGPKLTPRAHVEEHVACPTPETASGPECKPDQDTCDTGLYCLSVGADGKGGTHCEPCPERESIRHEFKDRDFVAEQSRDPFQSFVIVPPGFGQPTEVKPDLDKTCTRADLLVATNYSYEDLHLVGIVAQGTQRKALMMDPNNLGHIVKRNDCVGKEKAIAKDIGTGYVTFVVAPENDGRVQRPAVEKSVQLYPNGLQPAMPTSQPPPADQAPTTPVIAPPSAKTTTAPPPPAAPAPVIAPPPAKK
ncbi:MAG: pilus assembly protein PilP [Deltaproteobacteria bacterium]|nr:pilus assembly protein PilP [Deltaproteobacteria bacterium]